MTKNKKNKCGRPRIELDALQIRDVELLAAFLPINKIADYLGVSSRTFYRLKEKDSDILAAYKRGVARAHAHAGNILMKFMQYDGEDTAQLQLKFQAAKFYAQTKAGWGREEKSLKIDIPDDATPLDILNIAISKISTEGLTITECKQLTDFAQIKQQMLNSRSEQEQVQPIIPEEVVVKHLDKFNEAMRHINEHRAREEAANYEKY
jgi:hypothetical protein